MTSPIVEQTVKQCVVCNQLGNSTTSGDWRLVYHYDPPDANVACGHWIHENCRYRDDAPVCACGRGPAEEGLTRDAIDALHPSSTATAFRDEAVPTREELDAMADGSMETDDDSEDD